MDDLTGDKFRQQMWDRYRWMMRAWVAVILLQLGTSLARCRCDELASRLQRIEALLEVPHE